MCPSGSRDIPACLLFAELCGQRLWNLPLHLDRVDSQVLVNSQFSLGLCYGMGVVEQPKQSCSCSIE